MSNKKIWHYSPKTGELLYETEARESPKEPGVFLIPSFSTDIEPPTLKDNRHTVIFNEKAKTWKTVEDYRNIPTFSKETGKETPVHTFGPLPENLTTIKKPGVHYIWNESINNWEEDKSILTGIKLQKNSDILKKSLKEPIEFKGYEFICDSGELSLALTLPNFPKKYLILDVNSKVHEFTKEELINLASTLQERNQKLIKIFNTKKRKIEEA